MESPGHPPASPSIIDGSLVLTLFPGHGEIAFPKAPVGLFGFVFGFHIGDGFGPKGQDLARMHHVGADIETTGAATGKPDPRTFFVESCANHPCLGHQIHHRRLRYLATVNDFVGPAAGLFQVARINAE